MFLILLPRDVDDELPTQVFQQIYASGLVKLAERIPPLLQDFIDLDDSASSPAVFRPDRIFLPPLQDWHFYG